MKTYKFLAILKSSNGNCKDINILRSNTAKNLTVNINKHIEGKWDFAYLFEFGRPMALSELYQQIDCSR
jgi:hypothetical protein